MNAAYAPFQHSDAPTTPSENSVDSFGSNATSVDDATWILRSVAAPGASTQEAGVDKLPFRIGRKPENDLAISNGTVSSHHAELLSIQGVLCIEDMQSTNGTFVNGVRIQSPLPISNGDVLQFGTAKFSVRQASDQSNSVCTAAVDAAKDALAHVQFERLLSEQNVTPYFQPVIRLADSQRVGFEVLARSKMVGLRGPNTMFRVAEERGQESELSSLMRIEGLRAGRVLGEATEFFLNTHPSELQDDSLFESLEQLRNTAPDARLVLEIHEAAVTPSDFLKELRQRLKDLNMGLAYDDFGAGQARLFQLVEVPPDVIKFDICLVQGLAGASPKRYAMIRTLVEAVRDLGVTALAEGVETAEDADVCRELRFELAQGYFFGEPAPASDWLKSAMESGI